ncbi:Vacuolar protein sorting-associated protein 52 [Tieghemiomyces parasiticus]|uniref:Vacuolar protein sorting-associated protein 52 n=1 Tax=Tieghemiomyces parasiticus TaxID=78921 RepID=A0A9W8A8G5_9FUNG|nr:Vacuolar protein sorting-associated protein 52 [Tieghemiomyces parasiticus]
MTNTYESLAASDDHDPAYRRAVSALAQGLLLPPSSKRPNQTQRESGQTGERTYDWAALATENVTERLAEFQEDEIISGLLTRGLDLKEHARDIERQLRTAEADHLENYYQQQHQLRELDTQVHSCVDILDHMEGLLSGFQTKLGNINQEIRELQDQSVSMSVRLRNRVQVETQLERAIDGLVVSPDLIRQICDGEVDHTYLAPVAELDRKMRFVRHQGSRPHSTIRALDDVGPELERLRLVASAKIRHLLLAKIKALRQPGGSSLPSVQRNFLIPYQALNHFLIERHPEAAQELRDNYIHVARVCYADHFERYSRGLHKLHAPAVERLDLLGQDESSKLGGLFGGSRPTLRDRKLVFSLGERANVLTASGAPVPPQQLLATAASASGSTSNTAGASEDRIEKLPFESLFLSYNQALVDDATQEYEFELKFFVSETARQRLTGSDIAKAIFEHVFDPACHNGLVFTRQFVENTFDALGVLLCIRINQQLANELQRRRVPVLEGYINATNMLLWPRFQAIVSLHIDSIRKVCAGNRPRLTRNDVHPHFVSRRYAEFVASLLTLNQAQETNIVDQSLRRLRNELESMFVRISEGFNDRGITLIFLINNYDLIVTILNENGFESGSEEEVDYFTQCKATCVAEYVEEQLDTYFGYLKAFVGRMETLGDTPGGSVDTEAEPFEAVVADFNANFRNSLANINAAVIRNFSNFKNGTTILHSVLGQLILYYNRFYQMFERRFSKKPSAGGQARRPAQWPVGIQNVMVEIKKYKSNF